jgi:hypothetical protein
MPLTKAKTDILDLNKDTIINGVSVGCGGGGEASNTRVGNGALSSNSTGTNNTAVGNSALSSNSMGTNNTAVGASVLSLAIGGSFNTAIGSSALFSNTAGENTAVGANCLMANTSGGQNTAIGVNSCASLSTGAQNTIVGLEALGLCETGNFNVAVGKDALFNTTTSQNTSVGWRSLYAQTTGNNNTAIGMQCLDTLTTFTNCAGIGWQAQVTGSNQVRLGNALTTAVTSQVGNLSDERDKAEIRDTVLGLDFIKQLRPVDWKWDFREDYREEAPVRPSSDATEEEKEAYKLAHAKWLEDSKLANITNDGTHKRNRFHHGLIAQEIKSLIETTGVDFGGFQDHTIKGGDECMTIGYNELIAPMIKAIQELSAEVASLKAQLNP